AQDGVAQNKSDRHDRPANTRDSRRCAARRRVCLSREAVRRRGVSLPCPSSTRFGGVSAAETAAPASSQGPIYRSKQSAVYLPLLGISYAFLTDKGAEAGS